MTAKTEQELRAEIARLKRVVGEVREWATHEYWMELQVPDGCRAAINLKRILSSEQEPIAVVEGVIPCDIDTSNMWDGSGGLCVLSDDEDCSLSNPIPVTVAVWERNP